MYPLLMTAHSGRILGPIALGLGELMNYIYIFLSEKLHIDSVAVAIIIFTCIIYLLLLPLTYRQQKFSILSRKMAPETQAIQKKYKGKKDRDSMMAMQDETKAVYDKYGVSPSGSCVQAFIQLPIIYALFYVFRNVPAYIESVKNIFSDLVDGIVATNGFQAKMQQIYDNSHITRLNVDFNADDPVVVKDYIVDVLYKLGEGDWDSLRETFSNLGSVIDSTQNALSDINYFFILNISDTPLNVIRGAWSAGTFGLIFAALLIPIFSWASQMLNLKLMPQAGGSDQMARQMRMMTNMMPLISLVFTFSVPIGLGLYWITGALFRSLLQVIFNKHFEKLDLDKIVEKNKNKAKAKQEKRKKRNEEAKSLANVSNSNTMTQKAKIKKENESLLEEASKMRENAPANTLAAKANLVKDYNNRNNKK